MKKIYQCLSIVWLFACILLIQFDSQAQRTTIAGWTFTTAANALVIPADCGAGTIYADGTNGSSTWNISNSSSGRGIYFGNAGTIPTNNLCEETIAGNSMQAVGSDYNDSCWVFVTSTSGMSNIQMSFNHRGTSAGFKTQTWAHSTDGINFVTDTVMTGMNSGSTATFANVRSFDLSADADNQETLYIKVVFSEASSTGNNRLDNFCISGESSTPSAAQPAFSVAAGNQCNPFEIEITCETENASIYYTTDGTSPDNVNGTLYTGAFTISATTTLKAIAYAEGLNSSAVKLAEYTFPTEVATIADFKANTEDSYFKLTGEIAVSCKADPSSSSHYIFVQDSTAATCLFQNSSMGTFYNGDIISGGLCGVKSDYYGMIELSNPELQSVTVTQGEAIEAIVVPISEINSNFGQYECKLVTVTNARFEEGSFTTSINSILGLMQGTDILVVANQFRTLDNQTAPTANCNVTGILIPHDAQHRLCPRNFNDIEPIEISVAITAPYSNQVFEQGDPIYVATETHFFEFENGNSMQVVLSQNENVVSQLDILDETGFAAFEQTDFSTELSEFGEYQIVVNLLDADSNLLATDSVSFSYTMAYVAIETSESALYFSETGESHTFTVSAFHLSSDIALSIDDTNFVVTPTTLAATANNDTVTVTFIGTASASAELALSSDTVSTLVSLNAELPIDEVIYTTGFEASELFSTSNSYNNDTPAYFGPDGQQWSTIHGTVTATQSEVIFGEQVLQMRYYGSTAENNAHLGHIGYATTNFELHNVTKVEFFAKNNGTLNLTASYSFDGGETFEGDTTFFLTSNAQKYVLSVSDSGQHYGNRIRFTVALPEEVGTGTYRVSIDSVVVYGVTGLEPVIVETPTISEPTNSYITPINVTLNCETEGARIFYTTDGSTPDTTSTLYTTPITISSTCTLKARGFKGGMDPSLVAFAEYTFPTEVATIAAFKAAGEANQTATYKITGDVTFVYRNGRRIFIEDATGGLLVFDESEPVVTGSYSEGDVISGGIIGTFSTYNGMTQFIPAADWSAASGNVTVTPTIATANEIRTDFDTWEARLVRINDVTFLANAQFAQGDYTEVDFEDATAQLLLRDQFQTLDTTIAEGDRADLIGFVAIYNNGSDITYQIFPRSNADLLEVDTTAIAQYDAAQLRVYPNPAQESIRIESNTIGGHLEIVNTFGQVVYKNMNPVYPLNINLTQNAAGIYFVRITSANQQVSVTKFSKL